MTSNRLVLVMGPRRSGRSTLLETLQQQGTASDTDYKKALTIDDVGSLEQYDSVELHVMKVEHFPGYNAHTRVVHPHLTVTEHPFT
jgi:ABC-type lipoprotein export system ATPase subunit